MLNISGKDIFEIKRWALMLDLTIHDYRPVIDIPTAQNIKPGSTIILLPGWGLREDAQEQLAIFKAKKKDQNCALIKLETVV